MAEAFCKMKLASVLGCPVVELEDHGFTVLSAGISASPGDPVNLRVRDCLVSSRWDASEHRSRLVNPELLSNATDVVVMTELHRIVIEQRYPKIGPKPILLCQDQDLPDPFGGALEIYQACAHVISIHLDRLITEWLRT